LGWRGSNLKLFSISTKQRKEIKETKNKTSTKKIKKEKNLMEVLRQIIPEVCRFTEV
jgi:hypothetical protein